MKTRSFANDPDGALSATGGQEGAGVAPQPMPSVSGGDLSVRGTRFSHLRALICGKEKLECEQQRAALKQLHIKCDVLQQPDLIVRRIQSRSEGAYAYRLCILDEQMVNANPTLLDEIADLPEPRPLVFLSVQTQSPLQSRWAELVSSVLSKPLCESNLFNALMDGFGDDVPQEVPAAVIPGYFGKHAMIVEDSAVNADILRRLLEKAAMTVTICENGKIALERFAAEPADTYQIIFMDVQMPVMGGYEATREIRRLKARKGDVIPILAVSANASPEALEKSRESGMNAHLSKPIHVRQLFEMTNWYLSL